MVTAFLVGCGGGSGSASYTVPPNAPAVPALCAASSGASIQQIYPAPGASAVSDSLSSVIVAAGGVIQSTGYLILVPSGSSVTQGGRTFGALTQTQSVPTGAAAASVSNPIYYASANSSSITLPSNTLISVYFADSAQSCTPAVLGAFTSQ